MHACACVHACMRTRVMMMMHDVLRKPRADHCAQEPGPQHPPRQAGPEGRQDGERLLHHRRRHVGKDRALGAPGGHPHDRHQQPHGQVPGACCCRWWCWWRWWWWCSSGSSSGGLRPGLSGGFACDVSRACDTMQGLGHGRLHQATCICNRLCHLQGQSQRCASTLPPTIPFTQWASTVQRGGCRPPLRANTARRHSPSLPSSTTSCRSPQPPPFRAPLVRCCGCAGGRRGDGRVLACL